MKRIFTLTGFILLLSASILSQSSARDVALAVYNRGDIDRAIPMLESALMQNQTDAELLNALGMSYAQKKEGKKAVKYFLKALGIDPANTSYRTNLAMVYLVDKEFEKALDEIQSVIKKEPGNAAAYLVRGKIYLADKQDELAEKDADRVLSIEPSSALAHSLKADALYQRYIDKVRITGKWKENSDVLLAAADTLRNCLQKCQRSSETVAQESKLAIISAFYDAATRKSAADAEVLPGYKPLKILRKFAPGYRDQARANRSQGTVRLLVLFGADGKIPMIIVLKGIDVDLDKAAVDAAFKI